VGGVLENVSRQKAVRMDVALDLLADFMKLPDGVRVTHVYSKHETWRPKDVVFVLEGPGLPDGCECDEGAVMKKVTGHFIRDDYGRSRFDRFTTEKDDMWEEFSKR